MFQGNLWWQEKQVFGTITVSRNSFFTHGKMKDAFRNYIRSLSFFFILILSLFFYSTVIASNILLVDEIMRAGMSSLKG